MSLFIDASVFFAAIDRGDERHASARVILERSEPFITTDHVLVEVWTLLHVRLGKDAANRFWATLRDGAVEVEHVRAVDLERAWMIGEAFADQDFSIVDRTSFAVMERLGIHRAASLDKDFAVFRFGARRERAFEIVR